MTSWFLTTKLGRTVGAAIILTIVVFTTYKIVHHRAFNAGKDHVQAKWDAAKHKAREQARDHEAGQSEAGGEIAAQRGAAAATARSETGKTTAETEKVIQYVYRDPPKAPPARLGACTRPVDPRVQSRIELGVDQARAAAH